MFKIRKDTTAGEIIGILILTFAIMLVLLVFYYWLYGVIAVEIFGLPALSFLEFIGLRILIGSFVGRSYSGDLFDLSGVEKNGESNSIE